MTIFRITAESPKERWLWATEADYAVRSDARHVVATIEKVEDSSAERLGITIGERGEKNDGPASEDCKSGGYSPTASY